MIVASARTDLKVVARWKPHVDTGREPPAKNRLMIVRRCRLKGITLLRTDTTLDLSRLRPRR